MGGKLEKADFWRDPVGDRILLGFIGQLDEDTQFTLDPTEIASVYWATLEDIEHGDVKIETYDSFLREVFKKVS
jgi:NADH pyrophosphatase NudC (nudix superfamily)